MSGLNEKSIRWKPGFFIYAATEDECSLVELNNCIITYLTKEEAERIDAVQGETMIEQLVYREMTIEACERYEVIAVYIPDNKEQNSTEGV